MSEERDGGASRPRGREQRDDKGRKSPRRSEDDGQREGASKGERLRELIEHTHVGIYRTTPDGKILLANRALVRMLGFESFEDLAKRNLEAEGFDESSPREIFRRRLERNGEVKGFEVAWTRRDGTVLYLSENARAVLGDDQEILYYEGTVEDITERKLAQEALRESESKYRSLIETLPYGVAIVQHNRIVFANPTICRMLRMESPEDIIGQPGDFALFEEDRPTIVPMIFEALENDGPWPVHFFSTTSRPDGSWFPSECFCSKISFGHERALQFVIMDITERRRYEEERERLMAQLHQADKLTTVGELAAGVAHEINNPLAFVLPNITALEEQVTDLLELLGLHDRAVSAEKIRSFRKERLIDKLIVELPELLIECRDGIERIRSVTMELRQFARIDAGDVERVHLHDLVDSALTLAANEIKYRAQIEKDYGETPSIIANRGKLGQVFLNIILNAVQAIDEGDVSRHWIKVSTGVKGMEVYAKIRNSGSPIPPEVQTRIFDPFFTTKPRGRGTGLGLSIAYSIVQQHGGRIEVSSDASSGTSFCVWLPIVTGMQEKPPQPSPRRTTSVKGVRVLMIDDEKGILRSMQRVLRDYSLVVAGGGREALDILMHDQGFHVIFCDLMMPEVSGMEVFETVVETHPRLAEKFVFVTGGAFTPRSRAFINTVGNRVIEKPFNERALRAIIEDRAAHTDEEEP